MKSYLQSNAVTKVFGAAIIASAILFEWVPARISENYEHFIFAGLIAVLIISPKFARRAAIAGQIKYRRTHGKWRWDR